MASKTQKIKRVRKRKAAPNKTNQKKFQERIKKNSEILSNLASA